MAMVRFATVCDFPIGVTQTGPSSAELVTCRQRSEEYTTWPHCRECGHDCCPTHEAPDTRHDADLDTHATCLCVMCVDMVDVE